jgi:hypothetical protein
MPEFNCKCDHCGKEFYKNPCALKKSKHHFCCMPCKDMWQKTGLRGENNPFFNKTHTEEARKKQGESKIGVVRSEESKRKQSDATKGKPKPEVWKQFMSELKKNDPANTAQLKRMGYNLRGVPKTETTRKNMSNSAKDKPKTDAWRKSVSAAHQGVSIEDWLDFAKNGKYCGLWSNPKYKVRKRVRARFDDRCILCGKTRLQNDDIHMSVHHVYRNKDACCEGKRSEWLFATLCKHCHGKSGHNEEWIQRIREIIAFEYGNKCMLSLEEYNELYPNGSEGDKKWGNRNGT